MASHGDTATGAGSSPTIRISLLAMLLLALLPPLLLLIYWLLPANPALPGALAVAAVVWLISLLLAGWVADAAARRLIASARAMEQGFSEASRQKEVLLREVHHRVKNSMQIVASLVSLHASRVHEGSAVVALSAALARINALASIHREMYAAENLEEIAVGTFMEGLLSHTPGSGSDARQIRLTAETGSMTISPVTALPLGMLTLELIEQAIESSASSAGPVRQVELAIRALPEERISMTVYYPAAVRQWQSGLPPTLGQTLVAAYVRQLHADLDSRVLDEGSTLSLSLPASIGSRRIAH